MELLTIPVMGEKSEEEKSEDGAVSTAGTNCSIMATSKIVKKHHSARMT